MYLTRDKMFQLFHNTEDGGIGEFDLTTASDEEILDATDEELGLESDEDDSETNTDDGTDSNVDSDEGNEEETEELEESEESEDEQEQEEQEEEQENPEETELENLETQSNISFRAIKEKYPNIFKEFPALKAVVGKTQQYDEVFGDVNTAREVAERVQEYDQLASELEIGSPIGLLQSLGQSNPAALKKFADNILPALHRIHPQLFLDTTAPVLTTVLNNVIREYSGKDDQQSKNFVLAARYMSQYLFNDPNVPDLRPTRTNNQPDPEKLILQRQNETFVREKFEGAALEVDTAIKTSINKMITPLLSSLKSQPKYVQDRVKADILKAVDDEIAADSNFVQSQKQLWARASRTGFQDKAVLSRIKTAYLERGKQITAKVAKRVLNQTGLVKTENKKKVQVRKPGVQNAQGAVRRGGKINASKINPGHIDYRATSDMDILNGNFKFKGQGKK